MVSDCGRDSTNGIRFHWYKYSLHLFQYSAIYLSKVLTSFHVRVLLALRALSTALWYSPRCTNVEASLAKLDTLLYRSLAASYMP